MRGVIVAAVVALHSPTAGAQWKMPETGYDLLTALQQGPTETATADGADRYGTAIGVRGYILGVLLYGVDTGAFCLPAGGVKYEHAVAVVRGYLEQHPADLSVEAIIVLEAALKTSFPCK